LPNNHWLNFIGDVNTLLIAFFGVSLTRGIGQLIQYLFKIVKEKEKENKQNKEAFDRMIDHDERQESRLTKLESSQELIVNSQLAALHNQIFNKANEYIRRDSITMTELDNFNTVYEAYKALGGNGTGHKLHEKVNAITIKGEGLLTKEEITDEITK